MIFYVMLNRVNMMRYCEALRTQFAVVLLYGDAKNDLLICSPKSISFCITLETPYLLVFSQHHGMCQTEGFQCIQTVLFCLIPLTLRFP